MKKKIKHAMKKIFVTKNLLLSFLMLLCALNVLSQNDCTCDDAKNFLKEFSDIAKEIKNRKLETPEIFLMRKSYTQNGWRSSYDCHNTTCCEIHDFFFNMNECERWLTANTEKGIKEEKGTEILPNGTSLRTATVTKIYYYKCIQCNASKASENNVNNRVGGQGNTTGGANVSEAMKDIMDRNRNNEEEVRNDNRIEDGVKYRKDNPNVVSNPFMDPDLYINQEQKTMITDEDKE
jgi:hypothetical protein